MVRVSAPNLLSLLFAALLWGAAVAVAGERLCPGDVAPTFSFADLHSGEVHSLDEMAQGGPLLVVFLQSACGTCIREMVGLKRLLPQQAPHCRVLGVFIDLKPRALTEYVALYDLPFTFTWDGNASRADAYGVSLSPTTFLLGPNRKVVAVYPGFTLSTESSIREDLARLASGR